MMDDASRVYRVPLLHAAAIPPAECRALCHFHLPLLAAFIVAALLASLFSYDAPLLSPLSNDARVSRRLSATFHISYT